MDESLSEVCTLSGRLSMLSCKDKGIHMWRLLDNKGLPSDEEIIEMKNKLDKAFDVWMKKTNTADV